MVTSNRFFKIADKYIGGSIIVTFYLLHKLANLLNLTNKNTKPKRILFCKFCCQGDALLSLYAIREFKENFPNTQISIAVSNKTKEVYTASNLFDNVIELNVSGKKGILELFSAGLINFIRQIKKAGHFDTYIDMNLYFYFSSSIGFLINANSRIGFDIYKTRSIAFTTAVKREKNKHEILCFYDLLNIEYKTPKSFEFSFIANAKKNAEKLLIENGWNGNSKIIAIVPGSNINWQSKRWPQQRFIELITLYIKWQESMFVVIGTEEEKNVADFLENKFPKNIINLAGKTNFKNLGGVLKHCIAFIGNDSGPAHYAAMLKIPTVAIFGPTNEQKWHPYGNQSYIITNNVECRPCYYLSRMLKCTHYNCLRNIQAKDVFSAVKNVVSSKIKN